MISSKIYSIVMPLNWILENKFFNIWRSKLIRDTWPWTNLGLTQDQLWSTTLAGRQSALLDVNHCTLSYMIQRSLTALK